MTLFIVRGADTQARCVSFINALDPEKGPWQVTVEVHKAKRSLDQNRLYHRWVGIIAKETGNTHNSIHNAVRDELLAPVFTKVFGKTHEGRQSTTELSVAEFGDFLDKLQAWAGSEGVYLPSPDER